MMMRFILADAMEEQMILSNRIDEFNSYFDLRYKSTINSKRQNLIRMCRLDFTLSQEFHDKNCATLKNGQGKPLFVGKTQQFRGQNGRSPIEVASLLIYRMNTLEKGRRQDARFKQQMIDADLSAGETAEDKKSSEDNDNSIAD